MGCIHWRNNGLYSLTKQWVVFIDETIGCIHWRNNRLYSKRLELYFLFFRWNEITLSFIGFFSTVIYQGKLNLMTFEFRMNGISTRLYLSSDLAGRVPWGTNWLVKLNTSKTKLISSHHHRDTPVFLLLQWVGRCWTSLSPSLDELLCLKFTPDFKWESYIASVAKDLYKDKDLQ